MQNDAVAVVLCTAIEEYSKVSLNRVSLFFKLIIVLYY